MNHYEYVCDTQSLQKDAERNKKLRDEKITQTSFPEAKSDLFIFGKRCTIHRDDDLAEQLHEEKHLINYFERHEDFENFEKDEVEEEQRSLQKIDISVGKEPLLMDRYDARTLLEDLHTFERPQQNITEDDDMNEEERKQIQFERFGGLALEEEKESTGFDSQDEKRNYEDDHSNTPAENLVLFNLPASGIRNIPSGIEAPSFQREFDIIEMTARKVRARPQFEVLLKVKEGSNPDFDFLHPSHHLHPFYSWCKNGMQSLSTEPKNNNPVEAQNSIGFLSMYGSSSSEDEFAKETEERNEVHGRAMATASTSKSADVTNMKSGKRSDASIASVEEIRTKRLKRAKMLRNHFSNR